MSRSSYLSQTDLYSDSDYAIDRSLRRDTEREPDAARRKVKLDESGTVRAELRRQGKA